PRLVIHDQDGRHGDHPRCRGLRHQPHPRLRRYFPAGGEEQTLRLDGTGVSRGWGWRRARGGLLAVLALVPLLRPLLEGLRSAARAVAPTAAVAPSAAHHPASGEAPEGQAEEPEDAEEDQQEPEDSEEAEESAQEVRAGVVGPAV